MSNRFADLHMHTHYSDGADSPAEVVARAKSHDLNAIAITDHDTLAAIPEARAACDEAGIELLPGVEISSKWGKVEVHILGLGVNPEDATLTGKLRKLEEERAVRAEKIVAKLNKLDVPVDYAALCKRVGDGVIGRMHIAQDIVELGFAETIQGAFDKYIKAGKPAYVTKTAMKVPDAVDAIHDAGGLAFIAHPMIGKTRNVLDQLLKFPFDGIEVFHSKHTPGHSDELSNIAKDRKLLITGGSDCHGAVKGDPPLMGKVRLPWKHYEIIRDRTQN